MNLFESQYESLRREVSRRSFLTRTTTGMGAMALASLLDPNVLKAAETAASTGAAARANTRWPGVVTPLHRPAKAKRVIHLCMAGGPSHLETLDFKPELAKQDGQAMPESITQGQPIAQLQGQKLKCLGPQHKFAKFGQSGQEICDQFPKLGEWPTNSASSGRWSPRRSITIPRTRS